jgi:hypothetical protein
MRGTSGRTDTTERHRRRLLAGIAGLLATIAPSAAAAQAPDGLGDFAGERLTYKVSVSRFGTIGRGSMTVGGPVDVRGTDAYVLRFEFDTRVGPVKVVNRSESWVDAERGLSLRFHKHEAHPLSKHDETVELFPEERRWEAADGTRGESPTDEPLDELSFIYHLRTMDLEPDSTYRLTRHFDAARNPTLFRVLRRDTVETAAGRFPVVVVEMTVRDPRRYRGQGVLRFFLSDDAERLPVRMESSMPVVGSAVLTLESRTRIAGRIAESDPRP